MLDKIKPILNWFSGSKFQHRIFLILLLTSLFEIVTVSQGASSLIDDIIAEQASHKALSQAKIIARIPLIKRALQEQSPELIQDLMRDIQRSSDTAFIVVGDLQSVRYFHPNPGKVGLTMTGGDNNWEKLSLGQPYSSISTGSMGLSVRGKAPVMDEQGRLVGIVSVGYMVSQIDSRIASDAAPVIYLTFFVVLLALFIAFVISCYLKKQLLGMEPESIARRLQERTAIMRSLYEGFVAVDDKGIITAANPSAREALSQGETPLRGRNIREFPQFMELVQRKELCQEKDLHITIDDTMLICNATRYGTPGTPYGTVISFRKQEDIELLTRQLSQVRQYVETLRVQAHEYANKLSVIGGMIYMQDYDRALAYIESQSRSHQQTIDFMNQNICFPKLRGLLMGKYHQAQELGIEFIMDDGCCLNKLPETTTEEQVIAIVGNLLSNAFEAVQRRVTGERQVTLLITDVGDDLVIEVEDNGPGIPDDKIPDIIRKGVTSKKGINHGVGLFLVNSIINQANGHLLFEPAQPSGVVVTAVIPGHSTRCRNGSEHSVSYQ
ncbi:sensor histidine kinase [Endozoicomonas gorgoniicola]|uniref:histidine kinase n=1 Tax=Endozoicomonas gorgoniicola TaxID=1234144 RepID=A0ABT3MZ91_9GAMM|nr:sensor histidine kinase [Endozoicomonas gorgoniicola]MCW7554690.1 sensor histidine kinase [Endozoicomonas gorgoniicola]